jgi:hypothetical protein
MAKLVFILSALAAAVGVLAGPTVAAAGAVHGEGLCGILLPGFTPDEVYGPGKYVVTPSGNGVLVCRAEIPVGPPRTLVIENLLCLTPAGPTTNSHTVITKSGQVTLTCHVNPST